MNPLRPGQEVVTELQALLRSRPIEHWIANARTRREGDTEAPLPGNATYVTSLWTHYGEYSLDECRLLRRGWREAAALAFRTLRLAFPKRLLEGIRLVDNQPLSTPLYPAAAHFRPLRPGEARRGLLDRPLCPGATHRLPARLVWLRPHSLPLNKENRHDARDDRLGAGRWRPLEAGDAATAVRLYDLLYRDKYSSMNPAFTPPFIAALIERGLIAAEGLELEGRLVAVAGFYAVDRCFTTPLFGYDTGLPRDLHLYRRLTHRVLRFSSDHRLDANLSAGVARFKRLRQAYPKIEYIDLAVAGPAPRLDLLARLAGMLLRSSVRLGL